mmetsp:Transcript_12576/g.26048  ORF Transcript_12576/g.26048 Transcript_12576/m.26048 type:complete len:232 (-) Transcript_12576:304-999(-)
MFLLQIQFLNVIRGHARVLSSQQDLIGFAKGGHLIHAKDTAMHETRRRGGLEGIAGGRKGSSLTKTVAQGSSLLGQDRRALGMDGSLVLGFLVRKIGGMIQIIMFIVVIQIQIGRRQHGLESGNAAHDIMGLKETVALLQNAIHALRHASRTGGGSGKQGISLEEQTVTFAQDIFVVLGFKDVVKGGFLVVVFIKDGHQSLLAVLAFKGRHDTTLLEGSNRGGLFFNGKTS